MSHLTISPPRKPTTEGATAGYKRLATHLQLPLTPHSYEFEEDGDDDGRSSGVLSSSSIINASSWSSSGWGTPSSEPRSVFEDWEDEDDVPAFEVSIDEDGAQVLHIPCESLYFAPPTPPRSVGTRSFSGRQSNELSPGSSSFSPFPVVTRRFPQSPTTFEIRISKPDVPARAVLLPTPPHSNPETPTPRSKALFLDTSFINSLPTPLNLSALSSSWCTPVGGVSDAGASGTRWNQREAADVPCSAVAFSPTDGFGESLNRHQTPSFA